MIITGGIYKGRKIKAPDESISRPTLSKVRMGVFNVLYSLMGNFSDKTFMDVFGGSGIMGIEALSRGFKEVCVFEKNPKAYEIIKQNYALLGIKPDLRLGDSLKLLSNIEKAYDIIYVDPPYLSGIYEDVFSVIKLNPGGFVIAEHSEDIEISGYKHIKTKNYGGKKISVYTN